MSDQLISENLTCEIGFGRQAEDFRCRIEQFSHFGLFGRLLSRVFLGFLKGFRIGVSIGVRARSSAEIGAEDRPDFIFRVSGDFKFDFSDFSAFSEFSAFSVFSEISAFSGIFGRIKPVVVWSSACMFSVLCVFQVHGTNNEFLK